MNPEPFPAESRSKEPLVDLTEDQYHQLMESRGAPKSTKNREQRRRDAKRKK